MIDYVLRRAGAGHEQLTRDAVARAADELPRLLDEGAEKVMNRLHARIAAAETEPEDGGKG